MTPDLEDAANALGRDPEKIRLMRNAILLCLNNRLGSTNAEVADHAAALAYDAWGWVKDRPADIPWWNIEVMK